MEKRVIGFLCALASFLITTTVMGQNGGKKTFVFLASPPSARVTGLAGSVIGVMDSDVNLGLVNPASLNEKMDGSIALNYNFIFADIYQAGASYGHFFEKQKLSTHAGIQFQQFGDFPLTDEYGVRHGLTNASESAVFIGASKAVNDRMTAGVNLKFATGRYDVERASALAVDAGINYVSQDSLTIVSGVIRNAGAEFQKDIFGTRFRTPLDIQIGVSRRLRHLPFRLGVIAHNLQQWDVRYDDPDADVPTDIFGGVEEQSKFSVGIDNFFRHMIFNGEFLLGKNESFCARVGYNHLRRRELSLSNFRSLAGFSLGFGLKVSKFRIDYGVGYYHVAGAVNHISVSTNLQSFRKTALSNI